MNSKHTLSDMVTIDFALPGALVGIFSKHTIDFFARNKHPNEITYLDSISVQNLPSRQTEQNMVNSSIGAALMSV